MAGLNLLNGAVSASVFTLEGGSTLVVASGVTGPALVTIHPRAIALYRQAPEGSPRNVSSSGWRASTRRGTAGASGSPGRSHSWRR